MKCYISSAADVCDSFSIQERNRHDFGASMRKKKTKTTSKFDEFNETNDAIQVFGTNEVTKCILTFHFDLFSILSSLWYLNS